MKTGRDLSSANVQVLKTAEDYHVVTAPEREAYISDPRERGKYARRLQNVLNYWVPEDRDARGDGFVQKL